MLSRAVRIHVGIACGFPPLGGGMITVVLLVVVGGVGGVGGDSHSGR